MNDRQIPTHISNLDSLLIRPKNNSEAQDSPNTKPVDPGQAKFTLERFQVLEQHLRNAPADGESYLELAAIYVAADRFADARRILEKGVAHVPEDGRLSYQLEEVSIARGRQVLEHAERVAAAEPTDDNVQRRERAMVDLANLRIQAYSQRYSRNPSDLELLLPWAAAARQLGRKEEAIELLEKAAKAPELRARASLQLGIAHQEADEPLKALACYRRAAFFRFPPPSVQIQDRALELAAALALQVGLIDSAKRYVKARLEIRPDDAQLAAHLQELQAMPL